MPHARASASKWLKVDSGRQRSCGVARTAGKDARRARRSRSRSRWTGQAPGEEAYRHGRGGRCRHSQPHPLQGAGPGWLVFRPAPARPGNPRPLRQPDRRLARRDRAVRTGGDGARPAARRQPADRKAASPSSPAPCSSMREGKAVDRASTFREFNGTVRVMAVAWTKDAVGHAQADVIVRDPVVITASLPRFLAPGDDAQMRSTSPTPTVRPATITSSSRASGELASKRGDVAGTVDARRRRRALTLTVPVTAAARRHRQSRSRLPRPCGPAVATRSRWCRSGAAQRCR